MKKVLFKSKLMRVNHGVNEAHKEIVQLVLVSPATGEAKAINVGASRATEAADALEKAAAAIRKQAGA